MNIDLQNIFLLRTFKKSNSLILSIFEWAFLLSKNHLISIYSSDGRVSEATKLVIRKLLVLDTELRMTATQVLDSLSAIIAQWWVLFCLSYTKAITCKMCMLFAICCVCKSWEIYISFALYINFSNVKLHSCLDL